MESYRKLRPTSLKGLLGQPKVIDILRKMKKSGVPHAVLLGGPSGCGKTTTAYIIKDWLDCGQGDFVEVNAADFNGINTVRAIRRKMEYHANGKARCWYIDEAHQLSREAQDALLKLTEDPPDHVYFIFSTTDPLKIIRTLRSRCSCLNFQGMSASALEEILNDAAAFLKKEISEEVRDRIIEVADGSAREALQILDQVIDIEDEDDQLAAVASSDTRVQAFDLCRLLLKPRVQWREVAAAINKYQDNDWEGFRRMVLAYARKVVLGGGKMADLCYFMISIFEDNWYDTGGTGLVKCCYQFVNRP